MLASLITVALLAGANAESKMSKHVGNAEYHAKVLKAVNSIPKAKVAVAANYVAVKATSTSYLKWYMEESTTGCTTAGADVYYYQQYGACLMDVNGNYEMSTWMINDAGAYNVSATVYTDAACTTSQYAYNYLLPSTCDTADTMGTVSYYVLSSSNTYSESGFGQQTWNSDTACLAASSGDVMDATERFFGQCYESPYTGIYMTLTNGCNSNAVKVFTDSACANQIATDDGDDDDDDDFYNDDLFIYCADTADDDAEAVSYTSFYCKSAASMVSPSAFAMVAATAAAVFATIM